jgi:hypothetical protein
VNTNYKWNRLWQPSVDSAPLTEEGFLYDRDSILLRSSSTTLFELGELADAPCLILLGEPGIGKSTEVELAYQHVREALLSPDAAMLVQLRDVDSRAALRDKVELTETFQAWLKGHHTLTLFLDSIDEGLLGFAALSSTIAEFLQPLPHGRLRLRLVSRTADWPAELTNAIAAKWAGQATSVRLAPLREADVRLAAAEAGHDGTRFLAEVLSRRAGALAARPVTLGLLLTIYRRDGALPRTRAAVYDRGCRLLAVEESMTRKSARRVGTLDAEQRLAVAGRVAFVLIFCNKSAVWGDSDNGNMPSSDVSLEALLSPRRESAADVDITLTKQHLEEVLHSALFTLRGPSRFSFAHQTFAEHLAAWYVAKHRPHWQQLRSFVFARREEVERIVPQLRETAARLAERHRGVLRRFADRDPEVMLRSLDVGSAARRSALVDALLNETRRQRLPVSSSHGRDTLARLDHPQLIPQIAAVLDNRDDMPEARRFAADVAAACGLAPLADCLARIALDPSEEWLLRYDALVALVVIDAPSANGRLVPLALEPVEDDEYEQLKGMALSLVWPDSVSVTQLFDALSRPRRSSMYGPYQQFLDNLGTSLRTQDLPPALSWAAAHAMDHGHMGKCVSSILVRAWSDLEDPVILDGFTKIAYARLRDHRPIVDEDRDAAFSFRKRETPSLADLPASDSTRRQLLATALLERVSDTREVFTLMHSESGLLRADDAQWVLAAYVAEKDPHRRSTWLEAAICLFYHSGDPLAVYDHLYPAALEHSEIRQELKDFVDGIELQSERAARLRETAATTRTWQSERDERAAYPPSVEHIVDYLERCETGDTEAWWHLCYYLARNAEGTQQNLHYLAIVRRAGWTLLDHHLQERIARAALSYLDTRNPALGEWVGKNVLYQPDVSGIRALHLLFAMGVDRLPPINSTIWKRWGGALVALTVYDNRDQEDDRVLVAHALKAAPEVVTSALEESIKAEDFGGHGIFALARLEDAWDDAAPMFGRMLRQRDLSPRSTEQVLVELLKRKIPHSEALASDLSAWPLPSGDMERQYTLAAMQAIMRSGSPLGHSLVWPRMMTEPEFAKELLLLLAVNRDWLVPDIMKTWGERRVADLYLWLAVHFPSSEDPHPDGVFSPSPRYNIGHWRQQLVTALSTLGTWEAVDALMRINEELPGLGHAHALRDAREAAWRTNWRPPSPAEALNAITYADVRLVRNGDELLRVINESLRRFQGALIGDTPVVRSLWHKLQDGRWRPDDEGALADAITLHIRHDLTTRGIIAAREVVIRRGAGSLVPGSRSDITVSAVTSGHDEHSFDTASVIIEVKCSWNPDVLTALNSQLVGDYLLNNQHAKHGVYVVGWYESPAWDRSDRRWASSARSNMASLLSTIRGQARQASKPGQRVIAGVLDVSLQQNIKRPSGHRGAAGASGR